jgi:hypothetical protein
MLIALMSFKSNPTITLLILGVIVGSYLYIKRKKNSNGSSSTSLFRFGGVSSQANQKNDLMLLLMFNQLNQIDANEKYLSRNHLEHPSSRENEEKRKSKEKAKELIRILED